MFFLGEEGPQRDELIRELLRIAEERKAQAKKEYAPPALKHSVAVARKAHSDLLTERESIALLANVLGCDMELAQDVKRVWTED